MPTHSRTGLPRTGPASERWWVTAAIIASVAIPQTKKPPRNSHGLAPSGPIRYRYQHRAPSPSRPTSASTSSARPFVRIGLRMIATGRHTMANDAPSSRPPARVGVARYSVSVFEMQRPATCQ